MGNRNSIVGNNEEIPFFRSSFPQRSIIVTLDRLLFHVTEYSKHKNGKHLHKKLFFTKKVRHDLDELCEYFCEINLKLQKRRACSINIKYVNYVYSSIYALQEIRKYSLEEDNRQKDARDLNILRYQLRTILHNLKKLSQMSL